MIVERSMHPQFLSNTYLAYDRPGGEGVVVDAGGPAEPIGHAAAKAGVTVAAIALTHRHHDHVAALDELRDLFPEARVVAHPAEIEAGIAGASPVRGGDRVPVGQDALEVLHTPGHTAGALSFHGAGNVFTGDTLFAGSVGGVRAPGHTTFSDLKRSIMETLLRLPADTVVRPGHTDPTTVAEEWTSNPFVRIWRGLEREGDGTCEVAGEPARLVLLARDYDGGHKAWVRWPDGRDDILPGSAIDS